MRGEGGGGRMQGGLGGLSFLHGPQGMHAPGRVHGLPGLQNDSCGHICHHHKPTTPPCSRIMQLRCAPRPQRAASGGKGEGGRGGGGDRTCLESPTKTAGALISRASLAPRPQAPRLRELGWRGVLDLWSGPWDGLALLTSLRTLRLHHQAPGCDGTAYARDLHERGRLGWLLDRAQLRGGSRYAAPQSVAGGGGPSTGSGGPRPSDTPPAPHFELAWLPSGLERCWVALPRGTLVVRLPWAPPGEPQPLAFRVDGSTVKLR
jgi:hypothetical protein